MAVDQSAIARVVGIGTQFQDLRNGGVLFLPQQIAVVGQGNTANTYATTPVQFTSALAVATAYGFGSPLHKAVEQLFPANGDGVGSIPVTVYPVQAGGSAVAATGEIVATGTATRQITGTIRVGGVESLEFVIPTGTAAAAIGAILNTAISGVLDVPVTSATNAGGDGVDLTAKWAGISGNDLQIEILDAAADAGVTFSITAMADGAVSPDVETALNLIGSRWQTMIVNAATPYTDTGTLDDYSTFGEGRWGALVRKPLTVYTGTNETDYTVLQTAGNARRSDRVNSLIVVPGSASTPWQIAARAVARIAQVAQNNPARDYGSQKLSGIIAGTDAQQFDYPTRDLLVKAGISTTELKDGVINLSDTVTMYHPEGDPTPAYRFVKTITKLQQVIYNLDLEFNSEEWDGAPLIPDEQPTSNREAKKPKTAKAAANAIIDNLGLEAIISDPATAKAATTASISAQNPDRLDLSVTVQVSGNTNIVSADLNFGFYFGSN